MLVEDIMTRDIVSVSMDDTLAWVKRIFDEKDFHHVVVTEEGEPVGVVSDRDLLRNVSPFIGKMAERDIDVHTLSRKVHQIMTRDLVTIGPAESLCNALAKLVENRVHCLPVVTDKRCVGILTQSDILRWCYGHLGCDLPDGERPVLARPGEEIRDVPAEDDLGPASDAA
ncbi:MAG: CBS domain-containing protein [Planctomycetota bacterium]